MCCGPFAAFYKTDYDLLVAEVTKHIYGGADPGVTAKLKSDLADLQERLARCEATLRTARSALGEGESPPRERQSATRTRR